VSDLGQDRIAAATDVFERLLRDHDSTAPRAQPSGAEGVQMAQLRTAAARTVDLYASLMEDALEGVFQLAGDLAGIGAGGEPPLLLAGRPGATLSASLWVHNTTRQRVRGGELWMTDLWEGGGAVVPGAHALITPAEAEIEPGSSAGFALRLAIPAEVRAAVYHGNVLSRTLRATALAVRLDVAA
jgi:hypothetical protein